MQTNYFCGKPTRQTTNTRLATTKTIMIPNPEEKRLKNMSRICTRKQPPILRQNGFRDGTLSCTSPLYSTKAISQPIKLFPKKDTWHTLFCFPNEPFSCHKHALVANFNNKTRNSAEMGGGVRFFHVNGLY